MPFNKARLTHMGLMTVVCATLMWLAPAVATAQTVTGTLQGIVSDPNSAVVPGATVTIRNVETGQERTVTTNDEGFYNAPFLPLGRYSVTATGSGFGSVVRENIEVTLNQTVVSDFALSPTVGETITVTDEAAQINTTNAEIKQSLTEQEIIDRPAFNQGNFLTLAETFTGFQENPTSGQNNPTASSGSSINFNGTGTRGATFQINGVNNDDSSENQNRQGASLSTIKEFQVITNNFTAEFGRGYGAVVLVQTKSGTNGISGDVYLYHNDSALNAKSYFSHGKKPVNRRNQFGFTTGFPIIKNRLFGFVSLDHTENSGAQTYTRDVFLASERDPNNWFGQTPANNTPANRAFIESVLARFPTSLAPNDSRSARTSVAQQTFDFPDRDYSGRFDWNPRESDNLFARWQYTRQRRTGDDIIIGERADQNNKQQNIGVTWTHVFTPTTVGEFRYGLGLRTTLVNIAAGNDTPIIRFQNPVLVAASIIGNAGGFPIQRYQTDYQYVYNISTSFGSGHSFKGGTDIRRQQLDDLADNFSRGFYNITTSCNGINYVSGFNSLLNGCVGNFQKGYGPFFLENRINETNLYAEDNWKVRPNLTLNLGLRYEYVSAPRDAEDRIDYGFGADKDNIEPRVGFAYSPAFESGFWSRVFGDSGDSSIRGGYGIYHGRLFQSVFSQTGAGVRFNPPNALLFNQSGNATSLFNPNALTDPTNGFIFTPGPQTTRHSLTIVDPGLQVPYTQQWNLSFERELPFRSSVRLSYTGNRGIGLIRFAQDNLPFFDSNGVTVANHPNNAPNVLYGVANRGPGDPRGVDVRGQTLSVAANAQCAGTGLPNVQTTTTCPTAVPLAPLEFSIRVPRTNERRTDGRYSTNSVVSNSSWSYYHGLQIEWKKKYSRGLTSQTSYTWSKSIDTTSEATFVGAGDTNQTGNSSRDARGYSRFHTPHRLTVFTTYQLPTWGDPGLLDDEGLKLGRLLNGWTISMVMKLAAGTPFTVIGTGFDDLNFDGFIEARPALLDPSILGRGIDDPNTSVQLLPASAFRRPLTPDYGCCIVGRNTFFTDGVQNFDFGIYRSFRMPFSEDQRLLFRADLFNAFNHVQFGFPNTDATTAGFGRITGTATQYLPRTVQLSFRYQF